MWPFKQKSKQIISEPTEITTVLCIPGNWNNYEEFKMQLFSSSGLKYLVTGNIIINSEIQRHYIIEFCGRDERIQQSFKYAGMTTLISHECINEISNHEYVVYISGKTGSFKEAHDIALAGNAILKAGGLGIKVETTGKAFEKEKWFGLLDNYLESHLYQMFVLDSIVDDDGSVYSCGMKNLGFKDTIVTGLEFQEAVDLISIFGYYQIVDKPIIKNNQTFSVSVEAAKFIITKEENQPSAGNELFENPLGIWRLSKI